MEAVDTEEIPGDPIAREMTGLRLVFSKAKTWVIRQRRKLPFLIWYGEEIDVGVTFSQDKLDQDDPLRSLFSGGLHDIEKQLGHMGISFDKGIGLNGRDWEWDWSLEGPISVRFRSRAKSPELRIEPQERPNLRLVSMEREGV